MKYQINIALDRLPEEQDSKLQMIIQMAFRDAGLSNCVKKISVASEEKK